MKKTLLVACALAAGFSTSAFAAEGSAGYVRAELGRSNFDVRIDGTDVGSDKDTSASFGGGYWFNPNIAVEGHVAVLSNTELDNGDSVDLTSVGVGVALKKNFGGPAHTGFFVGGRAGLARLTLEVRDSNFDVQGSQHSTKPYYGLGTGYDFNTNWGLSLNWDRRKADRDGVDIKIDTVSLGGEYRF